jgi:hypothetical protein
MALFPFLAVLICTMGSLIVLLVLVLQQARVQGGSAVAEAVAEAERDAREQRVAAEQQRREQLAAERQEQRKLRELHEELEWQREQFEEQHASQAEQVRRQRLELSHLEDHIRRLEDQHRRLMNEHDKLSAKSPDEDAQQAEKKVTDEQAAELAELQQKIADAKKKLEETRARNAKRPPSFAIVPYTGKNGTRRRPIYIECGEEGIVLHPEGVVFMRRDFEGPLGPGNPLDAALRTVREYWAKVNDPQQTGEPYPLLIVRPSGAIAYAMARAAMKSWEEEFGYELVDAETRLEFPPADPELEQLLNRTIRDARQRQSALAAAMPSRFQGEQSMADGPGFRSAGSGPIAGVASGAGLAGGASGSALSGGASNAGLAGGGQQLVPGTSSRGGGSITGTASGAGLAGGASGAGLAGGSGQLVSGTSSPSGNGSLAGGASGAGLAGGGSAGRAAGNGASAGAPGGSGTGAGGGAPGFAATLPGVTPLPGSSDSNDARPPTGGAFYGGAASQFNSASSRGNSSSSGNGTATTSGSPNSSANGSSPGSFSASPSATVAAQRGANWALPKQATYSTGISRPIRIRCLPDRLVIMPERGDDFRPRTVIWNPNNPQSSTEEFVAAIWKHTERWGIAVAGGYWKPVLSVEVLPGAAARYQELTQLLSESGLEFQEKQPSNARGPSRNTTR